MPHGLFVTAFFLGGSFVALNGILMLAAPSRHRRFLSWMGGTGALSEMFGPTRDSGLQVERRLAGLGIAAMGIYMIWSFWKG